MTGKELRKLRRAIGMTQQDVADYLGLKHRRQVWWLEQKGDRQIAGPARKLLEKLREENFQKSSDRC